MVGLAIIVWVAFGGICQRPAVLQTDKWKVLVTSESLLRAFARDRPHFEHTGDESETGQDIF